MSTIQSFRAALIAAAVASLPGLAMAQGAGAPPRNASHAGSSAGRIDNALGFGTERRAGVALVSRAARPPRPALVQDTGPRLIGGGENAHVMYGGPNGNTIGGGVASISGGADDLQITHSSFVTTQTITSRAAELVGGGENTQIVYGPVMPSNSILAGQVAQPRG